MKKSHPCRHSQCRGVLPESEQGRWSIKLSWIFILILFVMTPLPAFSWTSGFYAGAATGWQTTAVRQTITSVEPTDVVSWSGNTSHSKPLIDAYLGYAQIYGRHYWALELSKPFHCNTLQTNSLSAESLHILNSRISICDQAALHLIPGYLLSQRTLVYALLGVGLSHVRINNSMRRVFNLTTQYHKQHLVWQLGVGLQQLLATHWALRAAYRFAYYGRISLRGTIDGSPDFFTTHPDILSQQVLLGLTYYFHPQIAQAWKVQSFKRYHTYLGISGDLHFMRIDQPMLVGIAGRNIGLNADINHYLAGLSLYGGYGWNIKHYYLGVELRHRFITNILQVTSLANNGQSLVTSHMTLYNTADIDFRPGYWVDPHILFFGLLGISINHYAITNTMYRNEPLRLLVQNTAHGTRVSPQFGAGLEYRITPHLSLKGEYISTVNRSFKLFGANVDNVVIPAENVSMRSKMKIYVNTIQFGLSYYFEK